VFGKRTEGGEVGCVHGGEDFRLSGCRNCMAQCFTENLLGFRRRVLDAEWDCSGVL